MESRPEISVVIPVKNGAAWLDACLQSITSQTLFSQTEIIVIDSGSTDGTLSLLKAYPVKVHTIAPEEFNHGSTRNLSVKLAQGQYIVMTVQDAQAADNEWLQKLKDGFAKADNVAAVCGQQVVPHDRDKNPADWFRPSGQSSVTVHYFAAGSYDALAPVEKKNCCGWDNVTAMYRREVLEGLPFPATVCSEDIIWADLALKAGKTLVYNTAAKVYHYHQEDWGYVFSRTLSVMHTRYRQFGFLYERPSQSIRSVLSLAKTIAQTGSLSVKEKWRWWRYNRRRFKATVQAYNVFTEALGRGEQALDETFIKYCTKVHRPLQPTGLNASQLV